MFFQRHCLRVMLKRGISVTMLPVLKTSNTYLMSFLLQTLMQVGDNTPQPETVEMGNSLLHQ